MPRETKKGEDMILRYLSLRLKVEWLHVAMTWWGKALEVASGEFLLTSKSNDDGPRGSGLRACRY